MNCSVGKHAKMHTPRLPLFCPVCRKCKGCQGSTRRTLLETTLHLGTCWQSQYNLKATLLAVTIRTGCILQT